MLLMLCKKSSNSFLRLKADNIIRGKPFNIATRIYQILQELKDLIMKILSKSFLFLETDSSLKAMTETVADDMNKYKHWLNIYNKYPTLAFNNDNDGHNAASDVF
jgi:hypothetical protein